MKILRTKSVIDRGSFSQSPEYQDILEDVKSAILSVGWPDGSDLFTIRPVKHGNGVVPIKKRCMAYLKSKGWSLEKRMELGMREKPGPVDATKELKDGLKFAFEWETGNISSSHRAMNKLTIGILNKVLAGGILVLPSRILYPYLTDRIGNFDEIAPYFPVYSNVNVKHGVLTVIEIEHDATSNKVPKIPKGTDGRARR